jgi:hypothetical protein
MLLGVLLGMLLGMLLGLLLGLLLGMLLGLLPGMSKIDDSKNYCLAWRINYDRLVRITAAVLADNRGVYLDRYLGYPHDLAG